MQDGQFKLDQPAKSPFSSNAYSPLNQVRHGQAKIGAGPSQRVATLRQYQFPDVGPQITQQSLDRHGVRSIDVVPNSSVAHRRTSVSTDGRSNSHSIDVSALLNDYNPTLFDDLTTTTSGSASSNAGFSAGASTTSLSTSVSAPPARSASSHNAFHGSEPSSLHANAFSKDVDLQKPTSRQKRRISPATKSDAATHPGER